MNKIILQIVMALFIMLSIFFATLKKIATLPISIWLDVNNLFRKTLHDMPHRFRKHLLYFDSCGLKYSNDHINSINVDEFLTRSFEEQAEYASEYITKFCKAGDVTNDNLKDILPPLHRNDIDVIGIANAAYVILNHPSWQEREKAYKTLNDFDKILNS